MKNKHKEISTLLYVSGSYPANPEGIAAGAKVLLEAMVAQIKEDEIILLTTDIPIIKNYVTENEQIKVNYMSDWKTTHKNIVNYKHILEDNDISIIHMEYPGDCYGKTLLASFLPILTKIYNIGHKKKIQFNVRLHEFTKARLVRKIAILPILLFADRLYVPAQHDRIVVSKIASKRVRRTVIGTNIAVCPIESKRRGKKVISYFGGIYPGKGMEHMFRIWKQIKEQDREHLIKFKIIGELDPYNNNHFSSYHKEVWKLLEELELVEDIEITGYVTDEEVSYEIQKTDVATLLFEDGLTLRRGSFIAYLSHGIPIVTSLGDQEARELFSGLEGVFMSDVDKDIIHKTLEFANKNYEERNKIEKENTEASKYFNWENIAQNFLNDYSII